MDPRLREDDQSPYRRGDTHFNGSSLARGWLRETMGSLPSVENDEYKKKAGRSPSSVPLYPPYTQTEGSNSIFDAANRRLLFEHVNSNISLRIDIPRTRIFDHRIRRMTQPPNTTIIKLHFRIKRHDKRSLRVMQFAKKSGFSALPPWRGSNGIYSGIYT